MRVGFVGWRGMVGSVLMGRMHSEGDFAGLETTFFSTSSPGSSGPDVGDGVSVLVDARDLARLAEQEVLITCQGGDYTGEVYPALRSAGWNGVWIDASSKLRLDDDAVLVLDPVNGEAVRGALHGGARTFVGANCTVSLLLMGMAGLFRAGQVEWISSMTYQAASGAGARALTELVSQVCFVGDEVSDLLAQPAVAALTLDQRVAAAQRAASFPTDTFGVPLVGSALPWIDSAVEGGQTREEWKAMVEANKLLGTQAAPIPIDGLCVRIGALRCHAQALTICLRSDLPLADVEGLLADAHPWSVVVGNDQESTLARLTPAAAAGSLQVPIGRLRKMKLGPRYLTAFTVGDQLLWGAAEPLRRMLAIVREAH